MTELLRGWGFATWDGRGQKGGQGYAPVAPDWLPAWIREVDDERTVLTVLLVSRAYLHSMTCAEELNFALQHARHRPNGAPTRGVSTPDGACSCTEVVLLLPCVQRSRYLWTPTRCRRSRRGSRSR